MTLTRYSLKMWFSIRGSNGNYNHPQFFHKRKVLHHHIKIKKTKNLLVYFVEFVTYESVACCEHFGDMWM